MKLIRGAGGGGGGWESEYIYHNPPATAHDYRHTNSMVIDRYFIHNFQINHIHTINIPYTYHQYTIYIPSI